MKTMSREKAKALIELAPTVEDANKAVEDYLGEDTTLEEKMAFLHGMFDYEVIGHPEVADDATYYSTLNAIINEKYGI